jgi:glycerol-3-phosphate acyltransferase PlsY
MLENLQNFHVLITIISLSFISYSLGSIPFGLFFVKIFHKVDIRTLGSKNIGATNVWRSGYRFLGLLTFLFDALKAIISAYFCVFILNIFDIWFSIEETKFLNKYLPVLCAAFAVFGHLFSIFLRFKGGKGVSTFFGFIFFFSGNLFIMCALVWLSIFALKRISSLSSLSVTCFTIFYSSIFIDDLFFRLTIMILSALIIIAHRENIKNLLAKKENGFESKMINNDNSKSDITPSS